MGVLEERITSTRKGSITSVQAVYVPADDYTDPAVATTFAHLDATTALSRPISELGIYPAVDPLASTSRILDPQIIGEEHYHVARGVQETLQRYNDLQDIIAILGVEELSEDDKIVVGAGAAHSAVLLAAVLRRRAIHRTGGQVREAARDDRFVQRNLEGKVDDLPEAAFFYAGTIDEVRENAERMAPMSDAVPFKLVTPAQVVFDGEAELVIAVTTEGEEGILPKHAPFLAALKPGVLRANVARLPTARERHAFRARHERGFHAGVARSNHRSGRRSAVIRRRRRRRGARTAGRSDGASEGRSAGERRFCARAGNH